MQNEGLFIKRKLLSGIVFLSLTAAALSINAQTVAPDNPFDSEEIFHYLIISGKNRLHKNRLLIPKLRKRGVRFLWSDEAEKRLRQAGANFELIAEIKYQISRGYFYELKNCRAEDYDCRIKIYDKTIALFPYDAELFYNRGLIKNIKIIRKYSEKF